MIEVFKHLHLKHKLYNVSTLYIYYRNISTYCSIIYLFRHTNETGETSRLRVINAIMATRVIPNLAMRSNDEEEFPWEENVNHLLAY